MYSCLSNITSSLFLVFPSLPTDAGDVGNPLRLPDVDVTFDDTELAALLPTVLEFLDFALADAFLDLPLPPTL